MNASASCRRKPVTTSPAVETVQRPSEFCERTSFVTGTPFWRRIEHLFQAAVPHASGSLRIRLRSSS
ncbi:protein of unknown function [Methylorubrum extorquens DM4]|uniref:Uncharacterized protein n=1 Tax=Methylorubrum extorquens (strain DSM 6343 / CIP 106787 / DM4) TaxID=661410 RepID=C7CD41_METED|nr:protein of unknown function [Methylorubrum extorquens DM4]